MLGAGEQPGRPSAKLMMSCARDRFQVRGDCWGLGEEGGSSLVLEGVHSQIHDAPEYICITFLAADAAVGHKENSEVTMEMSHANGAAHAQANAPILRKCGHF